MENCHPKRMPTKVGKGDSGGGRAILSKGAPKHMPRKAGSVTYTEIKNATPVTVTRSNWRSKNRDDPRIAEMRDLFGTLGL